MFGFYRIASVCPTLKVADTEFNTDEIIRLMKENFEQCKLMMNVTDKDLDVFSIQQQKTLEAAKGKDTYDASAALDERMQRRDRLQQAREAGRKALE